jgi:hypothetical protein
MVKGTGVTERGEIINREKKLAKYVHGFDWSSIPEPELLHTSFHIGSANPTGDLNTISDANVHIRFDATYLLTSKVQLMAMMGISQFTAESMSGIEHPRWQNYSLNLKGLFDSPSRSGLKFYVQGGPGYYMPKSGVNKFGFNLGAGGQIPIREIFGLEFGVDYHYIFTDEHTKFLTYQIGVLFR